ncbi:Uncharacterised protein [uncultured archaeon]|nr:Uncharacterised protein [uncultured archaeon]
MSKKHSRALCRAARTMNDLETPASGNPKRILRRGKNKLLGRLARQAEYMAVIGVARSIPPTFGSLTISTIAKRQNEMLQGLVQDRARGAQEPYVCFPLPFTVYT